MSSSHNPKALKSLGQHFLIESDICDKIIYSIGNIDGQIVLEIGPGMGALTKSIISLTKDVRIIAIEKDDRFLPHLQKKFSSEDKHRTNITFIQADALKINYSSLLTNFIAAKEEFSDLKKEVSSNYKAEAREEKPKVHIISNLPYNIGTELLFLWLNNINLFASITIMLQLEVAKKIVAEPGNKDYSWLSILSSLLCVNEIIMTVPPEAFQPKPKVHSAVVHLKPRITFKQTNHLLKEVQHYNLAKLQHICKKAFLQRRKKIVNSLKGLVTTEQLIIANISPDARPEEISVEQYCKLSLLI